MAVSNIEVETPKSGSPALANGKDENLGGADAGGFIL